MFGVVIERRARVVLALAALAGCGHAVGDSAEKDAATGGSPGSATGSASSGGASASSGGASASSGGASATTGGGSAIGGFTLGGERSTGGASVRPPSECLNPVPVPYGGGFVECADTSYRRAEPTACLSVLPRPERIEYQFETECWYDADCTAEANGYCDYGTCFYGCTTDSECDSDSLCVCRDPVGRCAPALCRSNADCPPDYPCWSPDPLRGFDCQNPSDQCRTGLDCSPRSYCQSGECQITPG